MTCRRCRRWTFRFAAIGAGVLPFLLAELLCIACGWGKPTDYDDPFVGFQAVHPLFVKSDDQQRYEIAPSRYRFFAPDSFAAAKPRDEFRVFCLGGSTVQGRPYSTETSFTRFLEIALHEADPERRWEVVNCGGISYASYRLVPVLQECLQHQPDLIILCTGHNEFLEDRTYADVKHLPSAVAAPLAALSRSRLVVLTRELIGGDDIGAVPRADRPLLPADADAMLDYHDGIAAFHRDDSWRAGVIEHFEFNVRRMVQLCQTAGVPVVLINEPSNLADQPPFKSEHRSGLSAAERQRWEQLIAQAGTAMDGELPEAVSLLQEALRIDPRYAETWYVLGKCRESLRQYESARTAFVQARDEDICPLRILSPMESILDEISDQSGTPLLDSHALLEARTRNGILGRLWLIDHIHPTIDGHQLIGVELVALMESMRLVEPSPGWRTRTESACAAHVDALPGLYFLRGEQTIERVRYWSQGLADGPPAEDRFPHRIPGATAADSSPERSSSDP